ncbi:hypothetical protein [Nocardia salmonicida]|uniref:hypothetical protein n=2 Tax=Nocardia salmonicida TaxID=53431 RepID=UPI001C3F4F20|nr:hypothetical protein [Nocardia salmonicida]
MSDRRSTSDEEGRGRMGTPMDDWKGLKQPGSMELQDGVATKAAEYCADVLDIIAVVEPKAGEVSSMPGAGEGAELFGHLESGRALAREFFKVGREFKDEILKDHKQVLNDMALSFLIAGNKYQNTDADSKAELSTILANRKPDDSVVHAEQFWGDVSRTQRGWADSTRKPPQNRYDKAERDKGGKYAGLPANLSGLPAERRQPVVVSAEPGSSMAYPDFHKLYLSLGYAEWILYQSSDWHRMAVQLERGFSDFDNRIKGLVDDKKQWTGQGADAAREAVYRYSGRGLELVRAMYAMSDNLLDAYNWASTTKANMPTQPAGEVKAEDQKNWETHSRDIFNNWYRPGIEASGSAIPVLPGPAGIKKVTDDKGPGNNTTTSPGGGGGNNSNGGSKAASDAAMASQLKAQQDAAHKQQLAALQQAEEQRKAQEAAQKQAEQKALQTAAQEQQQQAQEAAQSALSSIAEQVASQASSIGEQVASAVESAATQAEQAASLAGLSGIPTTASSLDEAAKKLGLASSKGGGAGGGGAGAGSAKVDPAQALDKASKLFPRASVAADFAAAAASRAGLAGAGSAGSPMGGPMGGGGAGAGAGGGQKDHKRADFLDSVEHLEEAIGEAQTVVRPVVEK